MLTIKPHARLLLLIAMLLLAGSASLFAGERPGNRPASSFAAVSKAWSPPGTTFPIYLFTIKDPATGQQHKLSSRDLRHDAQPLAVEVHDASSPNHPFARQYATVVNRGAQPLILEEVSLLALPLSAPKSDLAGLYGFERLPHQQWPRWFQPHPFDLARDTSKTREISFETGHWKAATWLALWRKSRPEGLIFGWETGVPTRCRIGDVFADGKPGVVVSMTPQITLAPGATFEVPKAFVGAYRGDLDEGCYRTQRFVEEHIAWPNPGPDFPYVMFNSWGYERAIDEPTMRSAFKICAGLGLEAFVADFGWEGPDWLPRPETFPNGLAPLADLCRAQGLLFGIHLSFTNVAHKSKLYQEHPDWVYGDGCWAYGQGKEPVHVLSMGLPQARQWAVNTVTEVLDREKVDWFLTDTWLWGHIDPAKHPVPGNQDYLAVTGFEQTMAEIHQQRPKVLIEHCDGGLSLINYKMMAQHVTSITCDNAQAIDTRLSVWDLSRILPPRYLDKYQQEWRSHYANRSCMFGGPWILMMPIHTLEPGSRDWKELTDDIALYKRYRSRIRDGKVLHLLAPSVPGDKAWDGWDAIGSYNPDEDAAIVFAFRTRGGPDRRVIPMKSLNPEQTYRVTLTDAGQSYRATGRAIMRQGITLELQPYATDPRSHCSEVILIEPEKGKL